MSLTFIERSLPILALLGSDSTLTEFILSGKLCLNLYHLCSNNQPHCPILQK